MRTLYHLDRNGSAHLLRPQNCVMKVRAESQKEAEDPLRSYLRDPRHLFATVEFNHAATFYYADERHLERLGFSQEMWISKDRIVRAIDPQHWQEDLAHDCLGWKFRGHVLKVFLARGRDLPNSVIYRLQIHDIEVVSSLQEVI